MAVKHEPAPTPESERTPQAEQPVERAEAPVPAQPHADLRGLQRSMGNQAVQRLLANRQQRQAGAPASSVQRRPAALHQPELTPEDSEVDAEPAATTAAELMPPASGDSAPPADGDQPDTPVQSAPMALLQRQEDDRPPASPNPTSGAPGEATTATAPAPAASIPAPADTTGPATVPPTDAAAPVSMAGGTDPGSTTGAGTSGTAGPVSTPATPVTTSALTSDPTSASAATTPASPVSSSSTSTSSTSTSSTSSNAIPTGNGPVGPTPTATPEFANFLDQLMAERTRLINSATTHRQQIPTDAETEKATAARLLEEQARRGEQGYSDALQRIDTAASNARTSISEARTTQVGAVNRRATDELRNLSETIERKRAELRRLADEKSTAAIRAGEEQARRATDSANTKAARARAIGNEKAQEYVNRNYNRAARIGTVSREIAGTTAQQILDSGTQTAAQVRKDASDLAAKFRNEARDSGNNFQDLYQPGANRINQMRTEAVGEIERAAQNALTRLNDSHRQARDPLAQGQGRIGQQIRSQIAAAQAQIDQRARQATDRLDQESTDALAELDHFIEQAPTQLGSASPARLQTVQTQVAASVTEFDAELGRLETSSRESCAQVSNGFSDQARTTVDQATNPLSGAASQFEGTASSSATQTASALEQLATNGCASMHQIVTDTESTLQSRITPADAAWAQQLADGISQMRGKVDTSITEQQRLLDNLSGEIDRKAEEIEHESFWSRLGNWLVGTLTGFFRSLGIFLLVLLIVVLVVVLIVVALAFFAPELLIALAIMAAVYAAEIAAVLAVLAFMAALVGIGLILYNLYVAIARDDLSDRERGEHLGSAIFDTVMLLFGGAIFRRLARLLGGGAAVAEEGAEAARIARLRGLFTDEAAFNRALASFGNDLGRLENALGRFGNDAARLETALARVGGSAERLETLLQRFNNSAEAFETMLARFGNDGQRLENVLNLPGMTVERLDSLLVAVGNDGQRLERLLQSFQQDITLLEDLLTRPGMTVQRIEELMQLPGMTGQRLNALLARPAMTPALLDSLLANSDDLAQLDRLLNMVPNAQTLDSYLVLSGGRANAGHVEALLNLTMGKTGATTNIEPLIYAANGNATRFAELAQAAPRFLKQPPPVQAGPANLYGYYSGADVEHFLLRHTMEYFQFDDIKAANTMWEAGTTPQQIVDRLQAALDVLHGPGGVAPGGPVQQLGVAVPGGFWVQVGSLPDAGAPGLNNLGQFFPGSGPGVQQFIRAEMQALKALLGY